VAELSDSQRKRAESREKRRKDQAEPANGDETQSNDGPAGDDAGHHGVKQAAKVAAGAAAVGAAAAAARALTSSHQDSDGEPSQESDENAEPQAKGTDERAEEPETGDGEDEPQRPPEPQYDQTEQDDKEPVDGAAPSAVRTVIERGREQLEDLLGRPVEAVSSLERTHDGWVLELEVVELSRIPESTDVLASYEMELDDDLNLRRYQQARRYHRGRAYGGDDA
jgi:gas vesicle protein GvpO